MEKYASVLHEETFRQSNDGMLEVSESRNEKQSAFEGKVWISDSILLSGTRHRAHTFDSIERRLTKPLRQSINAELAIVATILREARALLGTDALEQMPTHVCRIEAGFEDLRKVFQTHIDRLQYEIPNGGLTSRCGDHHGETRYC